MNDDQGTSVPRNGIPALPKAWEIYLSKEPMYRDKIKNRLGDAANATRAPHPEDDDVFHWGREHLRSIGATMLPDYLHDEFLDLYDLMMWDFEMDGPNTDCPDPVRAMAASAAEHMYRMHHAQGKNGGWRPPPRPKTNRREWIDDDEPRKASIARAWGDTRLRALYDTTEGDRNNVLFGTSRDFGRLVAGGFITEDTARNSLWGAARHTGLPESEIGPTIESGLASGFEAGWIE